MNTNTNKDELVIGGAKLLREFLSTVEIDWDEGFYRYVEYNANHISSQWSYRKGQILKLSEVDEDIEDKYFDTLEGLFSKLCSDIEDEGNKRPVVIVLQVDVNGNYKVTFENNDNKALEINKLCLGKGNSFFKEGEVGI
ncbi:hypothetical protein K6Y31_21570 [Motilimonas cestriensis]|uniref:Phage protein n=1 Tax=Motilimonas cestriensis TaxID=2742685 RepID=A0ABS8WJ34_9GAMM|nr:hypothetical protein [Motilimonas cestriensis]MCE2597365.1 hypothetical protein [Motilimonas cestriensis]